MTKEKKDGGGTARQEPDAHAQQHQGSTQSMLHRPAADQKPSKSKSDSTPASGLGSSVGQNAVDEDQRAPSPSQRPSAGTPDLPRDRAISGDIERSGEVSRDSLVNDPSGAFKERP
jgi:hypothetical protein